jgi:hypothetical protein
MNPDTNRFEELFEKAMKKENKFFKNIEDWCEEGEGLIKVYREDGSEVPEHWSIFTVGEKVVIKNYTFEVKYIGETSILFEPVSPVILKR